MFSAFFQEALQLYLGIIVAFVAVAFGCVYARKGIMYAVLKMFNAK